MSRPMVERVPAEAGIARCRLLHESFRKTP